jgi:hypothetical protein
MTVLVESVFPVGTTIDLLDALTDEMGVDAKLPAGGIVHVHFEKGGRVHRPLDDGPTRRNDHRGSSARSLSDDSKGKPTGFQCRIDPASGVRPGGGIAVLSSA